MDDRVERLKQLLIDNSDYQAATPAQIMELGIWLTGKGIGEAWTEAVEGHAP